MDQAWFEWHDSVQRKLLNMRILLKLYNENQISVQSLVEECGLNYENEVSKLRESSK